jgi:hypothetical protein
VKVVAHSELMMGGTGGMELGEMGVTPMHACVCACDWLRASERE